LSWKALLSALLMAACAPSAAAAQWVLAPDESQLEFVATYQGQEVKGVFRRFDVHFGFEPNAPATSKLDVSVALASADMGSADINGAIQGDQWFAVVSGPQAHFASTDIVIRSPEHYVANGTLRLKGYARQVAVPFTWSVTGNSARMEGRLVLKRTDFGIGTGEWASGETIGLDVAVRFDVKLRKGD
jgi:polyisoprenoid-binding protein YceI